MPPPDKPAAGSPPAAPSPVQAGPSTPAPTEATCLAKLAAIPGNRISSAVAEAAQTDPACRVEEPVRVAALALRGADGSIAVAFEPPPLLACAMAASLADWLDRSVQPLARGYFGKDLMNLRVGGGQECRRRNRASAGPVSEHATGKALDIFAFTLKQDGAPNPVSVEKPAGLVQSRFLEAVRQSACGAFMTVLGPGSDAAHANHLHVDIQQRRSQASRFCQ
ncbi:extensin-like domain-containing protein [Bosea thiooxidans]|uniref:extensin-like domain-containing protein n=1 Tax=Bosea thiooxidans TaxID=53254 RepID=UPI0015916012|nr:extensin family protein [Bosea thiooxidans]